MTRSVATDEYTHTHTHDAVGGEARVDHASRHLTAGHVDVGRVGPVDVAGEHGQEAALVRVHAGHHQRRYGGVVGNNGEVADGDLEVGRAQRTIFVCRYLRDRQLQRDTNSGLNVIDSWNGGNDVVFHGNRGQLTSSRQDERELSVLCLRILQAALVDVNTLMLHDVLAEPGRLEQLSPADRRGLTPLFWSHVKPYSEVRLDMDRRLDL